jgi:hypothetical protein
MVYALIESVEGDTATLKYDFNWLLFTDGSKTATYNNGKSEKTRWTAPVSDLNYR